MQLAELRRYDISVAGKGGDVGQCANVACDEF